MLERAFHPTDLPARYGLRPPDPMTRLFDRFFAGPAWENEELSNRQWLPATDIRETDDRYEVVAELPGMTKDDVKITLENNVLVLGGERRFAREKENGNYHRIERAYGTFSRSFTLPHNVDPSKVEAKFADGILTLTIPKTAASRPRKIAIH